MNPNNVFDVLETYARVGLKNVELTSRHNYVAGLLPGNFKQYDFDFLVHHYFPPPEKPFIVNLASQNPAILEQSRLHIKRAIDFCHSLGIKLFTFHAGFRADPDEKLRFPRDRPVIPYETAFNTFIESIGEINSYAQQRGIKIAIENTVLSEYNVINEQNGLLLMYKAEEFERLWDRVPSATIGIVLDLGHLKVTSRWLNFDRYQFIDKVKERVFAIHVHENNGQRDEHKELDETSWCLAVIGKSSFSKLPIILESTKLTIEQIMQQVSLMDKVLGKE